MVWIEGILGRRILWSRAIYFRRGPIKKIELKARRHHSVGNVPI